MHFNLKTCVERETAASRYLGSIIKSHEVESPSDFEAFQMMQDAQMLTKSINTSNRNTQQIDVKVRLWELNDCCFGCRATLGACLGWFVWPGQTSVAPMVLHITISHWPKGSYLFMVPKSIHAGLAASEVRLIDDIVVDQTGRVNHLRKEGDLSLLVY